MGLRVMHILNPSPQTAGSEFRVKGLGFRGRVSGLSVCLWFRPNSGPHCRRERGWGAGACMHAPQVRALLKNAREFWAAGGPHIRCLRPRPVRRPRAAAAPGRESPLGASGRATTAGQTQRSCSSSRRQTLKGRKRSTTTLGPTTRNKT